MQKQDNISEELRDIGSSLASLPRSMPYMVPVDYFKNLPTQLSSTLQIIASEDPVAAWTKQMPYALPEGYFEALQNNLAGLNQNTKEFSLSKQTPYTAPGAYFDTLPQQILSSVKASSTPRLIAFNPLTFVRWAAAAVLVLGIGFASYQFFAPKALNTDTGLASLPDQMIHEYVQQNMDDFDTEMLVTNLATENDIQAMTKDLNPDEIEQYLNESGWGPAEQKTNTTL